MCACVCVSESAVIVLLLSTVALLPYVPPLEEDVCRL